MHSGVERFKNLCLLMLKKVIRLYKLNVKQILQMQNSSLREDRKKITLLSFLLSFLLPSFLFPSFFPSFSPSFLFPLFSSCPSLLLYLSLHFCLHLHHQLHLYFYLYLSLIILAVLCVLRDNDMPFLSGESSINVKQSNLVNRVVPTFCLSCSVFSSA